MKTMKQKAKDGDISWKEYRDFTSIKNGYIDFNEYQNERRHIMGIHKPMSKNKYCGIYLGVYIAEKYLSKIFNNVTRMPIHNIGYDFICGQGYKIDVKSSCIVSNRNRWMFKINYNKTADYFLMLAFDNIKNKTPIKIWLIKSDTIIRNRKLNEFSGLIISLSKQDEFEKFELKDKLKKLIKCCNLKRGIK